MNPANFQGMGMPQMGMQMGQPQMGMTQPQIGQPQIGQPQMGHPQMGQTPMVQMGQAQMVTPTGQQQQQQQVLQYLRNQNIPVGWQQTCRIELRLSFVLQIITQLNLLRTDAAMQPVSIAIEFERKQFEISHDQMTYEGKCREKLQQLTDVRQNKQRLQQNQAAQNPQMNFGQPQMAGNSMFAPQQQFQQPQGFSQLQQSMQNPSMAVQQQHAQQQTQQQAQQQTQQQAQQQTQQQVQMQMRNGLGGQQVFANGQSGPNPSLQAPHGSNFQFTQQDQQHIQQIAQNIMNNMTPQDRHSFQQMITNLQPQLRQSLTDRGTNLSHYVVKQRATQAFLQQRARMAAQAGNHGAFPGAGVAPQGGPNTQGPTPVQVQQTPQFDQAGNMDHILRQQQDALHHQQEGQVVVPANSGQRSGNPQRAPSRVQKTPQQPQQATFGANRSMQAPNQTPQQPQPNWNTMQKQTPVLQQTPQMQQAQNFTQMPGQNPQQNPLPGQTSGMNNALRTPQQKPQMPTLNQPMNPPSQSQNVSSPNPAQQTPNLGQRTVQNSSNGQQRSMPNGQQRPTPAPNMPPKAAMPIAIQQHIANLKTKEEKTNFLMMMRQRQQLQRQQAANGNIMAQPNQGRGPQKQMSTSQTTPATGAQNMPNPNLINAPQAPMARVNQGPQQPDSQNTLTQTQPTLTELQEQQMDTISYPNNILNSDSVLARTPGYVKNWGQLKQWVASNAQNLPPDSLQKLKVLQAKHYQLRLQDPRRLLTNRGQPGNMQQQPPGPGPAPSAQTFLNGSAQKPVPQGQTPGQVNQVQFSQGQAPTAQEVQRFKANLPSANVMSEEQIRSTIMSKKRQDLVNAQQNSQTNVAQNQQSMQERYATLIRNQQFQQTRNLGLQTGQMPHQKSGQTTGPQKGPQWAAQQARVQAEQARQNQASQAGSKPQQGVKRSSNDDVVEVPDPKLAQHQPRQPPASAAAQPPASTGQPAMNPEQIASLNRFSPAQITALNPVQRAAFESQRRNIMVQANQRGVKTAQQQRGQPAQPQLHLNVGNNGNSNDPKSIKIKQLRDEVIRTMPPRQTAVMNPLERGNMIKKLGEVKGLFSRIDQSLPVYLVATQNEDRIKDIIRTQLLLASQFRDNNHNPVENFTISPDDFRSHLNNLQRYMTEVAHIVQQMQQKANQNKQAQQSQQSQHSQAAKPPAQATPPTQQLSAANLQQQQEALTKTRTATLNKTQGPNKPPAAPTTSHVPFPFGSQSPQGVPQIYVPKKNELTQDKLHLPVSKKQKKNLAASTGATSATAMSPTKPDYPEIQRLPPQPAIKCMVPDCKHPTFSSKELLDKHTKDVHEVKDEQITDPLEYVLGGLRMALNLDENGQSKHVEAKTVLEPHHAPAMKVSASSQGTKGIKQEVATPTSKTVAGLKTPQTKTSTPTPGRETAQPNQSGAIRDPWTSSNISQNWFSEVFRDVADPNRTLSGDFLGTWLEAQAHPDLSSDDSPQSTDKNSPRKSDISSTDNLDIKIVGEDGFLSENWFDVAGDMEALDMAGLVNMDWDTTFVAKPTSNLGKNADGETSDEWLKVFAPEKYSEKMKVEKKAVR